MIIRYARMEDVQTIYELVSVSANDRKMLHRSKNDIYEKILNFYVAENEYRIFMGCVSIHPTWTGDGTKALCEVRSLVVKPDYRKIGIGSDLVHACIRKSEELGASAVFALTYVPDFFYKLGFQKVSRNDLPRKVWTDCINCPEFPDCDESAVIISL